MTKIFKLRVPASSANLGSGFDSIGACLDIWNEIKFFEGEFQITNKGFGEKSFPRNKKNLIYKSYLQTIQILGKSEKELTVNCDNNIPNSGGLGSSSAAVISGIMIAYAINNIDMEKDEVYQIAAAIEGHPDNVGPAIFGGITIGYKDYDEWLISQVKFNKNLKIISFVSDQKISTQESRKNLPKEVSRNDSVYNISRAALLINSLANDNFQNLKYAFQDKIHEQYRTPMIKGFSTISNSAISAGALATYLSGSGPTISAIAESKELTINYEMLDAANKLGINGNGIICKISEIGAHLVEE